MYRRKHKNPVPGGSGKSETVILGNNTAGDEINLDAGGTGKTKTVTIAGIVPYDKGFVSSEKTGSCSER